MSTSRPYWGQLDKDFSVLDCDEFARTYLLCETRFFLSKT